MRGVLGPSWTLLGRSWDPLGRSWGALGPSWGALGAILARSSSLPHPKIRREKLRRAISDDFGSILVDFPDKNLRDPSENLRNPAENLPPSAVPRTPKNQLGCGGRAKRIQSAAPCVYAGSEAFKTILRTLVLLPSGSLPPLTPPPASARPPTPPRIRGVVGAAR